VPFDRSFGGKVVPEIVGGTGVLGIRDAWSTFDWASRVRLIKTYAKVILLQVLLVIVFTGVLIFEVFVVANLDMEKILPGKGQSGEGDL